MKLMKLRLMLQFINIIIGLAFVIIYELYRYLEDYLSINTPWFALHDYINHIYIWYRCEKYLSSWRDRYIYVYYVYKAALTNFFFSLSFSLMSDYQ